jgi:hypothetical protein
MVVKAERWARRALAPWDPAAVVAFLDRHDVRLAARVKREVGNKVRTERKSAERRSGPRYSVAESVAWSMT